MHPIYYVQGKTSDKINISAEGRKIISGSLNKTYTFCSTIPKKKSQTKNFFFFFLMREMYVENTEIHDVEMVLFCASNLAAG